MAPRTPPATTPLFHLQYQHQLQQHPQNASSSNATNNTANGCGIGMQYHPRNNSSGVPAASSTSSSSYGLPGGFPTPVHTTKPATTVMNPVATLPTPTAAAPHSLYRAPSFYPTPVVQSLNLDNVPSTGEKKRSRKFSTPTISRSSSDSCLPSAYSAMNSQSGEPAPVTSPMMGNIGTNTATKKEDPRLEGKKEAWRLMSPQEKQAHIRVALDAAKDGNQSARQIAIAMGIPYTVLQRVRNGKVPLSRVGTQGPRPVDEIGASFPALCPAGSSGEDEFSDEGSDGANAGNNGMIKRQRSI